MTDSNFLAKWSRLSSSSAFYFWRISFSFFWLANFSLTIMSSTLLWSYSSAFTSSLSLLLTSSKSLNSLYLFSQALITLFSLIISFIYSYFSLISVWFLSSKILFCLFSRSTHLQHWKQAKSSGQCCLSLCLTEE